jgi:hypothetical protein
MLFRSRVGAYVLIALGCLLLASNLGYLPRLGPVFHQWWAADPRGRRCVDAVAAVAAEVKRVLSGSYH